jgi:glycosyltransferase involved in cell wall biosynthesis
MEQVTWTLAAGLTQRGHEVTVVTTTHPHGLREERAAEGFLVRYVDGSSWRRYRARWWEACYRLLREGKCDVVLSQSAGGLGYLRRAHEELGLPVVVLLHGSAPAELRTAWRGATSPRGLWRLARLGWRLPVQALRWRAASPSVSSWLAVNASIASGRARVVPVGVDTERFRPDPEARRAVREELGIRDDEPVAVLATRLEREKGVRVALEAARLLPPLRLLIAGTGHDERRLRRAAGAGPRVTFLGRVDHDRLPRVLAAADLFVHPSLCDEGRPLSIVEAAAAGLPVVVSDSAGARELVDHGRTGLLVPRNDPATLAAAIRRVLDDPRPMAAAARRTAESRWSVEAMVDAVESSLPE